MKASAECSEANRTLGFDAVRAATRHAASHDRLANGWTRETHDASRRWQWS